jgi:hypothetical protein
VIEKQVQIIVLTVHLDTLLAFREGEVGAGFQDSVLTG